MKRLLLAIIAIALVGSVVADTNEIKAEVKYGSFKVVNNTNQRIYGQEGYFNHPFHVKPNDYFYKSITRYIRDTRLAKDTNMADRICTDDIRFEYPGGTHLVITIHEDFTCTVSE